jgi:pimeloyl-ACP methyl ester carboxylesterase
MVAQVKEAVQQLGPMTVIVAHCMGAFVAHKYLESWSVSGIALVNPVPPDPRKTIDRWLEQQGIKGGLEGAEEQLGYHGLFASAVEAPRLALAPEVLFNMDSSHPKVRDLFFLTCGAGKRREYLLRTIHASTYLSVYLSITHSIYLPTYPSIYLSIHLSIYLSIYLSIHLSAYPSIYPSIHPSKHEYIASWCHGDGSDT